VSGRLLETIALRNGLALEFWDESRPTAGNRWYVAVRAVVAVPVTDPVPESPMTEILGLIRKEVGQVIYYQFLEERHFISAEEVTGQQQELMRIFADNSLKYLSHPEFPGKFIRRKVLEIKEKSGWPGEQVRKILEDLRGPERGSGG
jgi:hypothetical protein